MNKEMKFIETKEYKRYAEFCDACIKYKYIGICYGAPGVGKTISSRYYSDWDNVSYQIDYNGLKDIENRATEKILDADTIFYTAPTVRASRITEQLRFFSHRLTMTKNMYKTNKLRIPQDDSNISRHFSEVKLIIIDEIDRLKIQDLEQLRDIYDQNDIAMVFIGMPGIEKRLSRYPQLYSRIGFSHEFGKLNKTETQFILEYKWSELGLSVKPEDFSDYEAITSVMKITGGNFRLIQRLFAQIDRILQINNLNTINVDVVEAARDTLVIGVK